MERSRASVFPPATLSNTEDATHLPFRATNHGLSHASTFLRTYSLPGVYYLHVFSPCKAGSNSTALVRHRKLYTRDFALVDFVEQWKLFGQRLLYSFSGKTVWFFFKTVSCQGVEFLERELEAPKLQFFCAYSFVVSINTHV